MAEIICDACQKQIDMNDSSALGSFKVGDIVVQYLRCPHCGKKYHMLTTNSELRQMIDQRKTIELQLKMAHAKHMREKVIRRRLKAISRRQKTENFRVGYWRRGKRKMLNASKLCSNTNVVKQI